MNTQLIVQISQNEVESLISEFISPSPKDDDYLFHVKAYLRDLNSVSHLDLVMFILHLEGYDYRTIGHYCSVSHSTVRNHVLRIRSHLRNA